MTVTYFQVSVLLVKQVVVILITFSPTRITVSLFESLSMPTYASVRNPTLFHA